MVSCENENSNAGDESHAPTLSRRCVWHWRIVGCLAIWQLGVTALAIVGSYFLSGEPLRPFVVDEHPAVRALIEPSLSERSDLLQEIQDRRLWHTRYLEGVHEELQCLYSSRGKSPDSTAKSWPIKWWSSCGKSRYIGRYREWAAVGIDAARYAWNTTEAMDWLDAAEDYKGYQASDWQGSIKRARVLLQVGRGEYLKASQSVARQSMRRFAGRTDPLAEALAAAAGDPASFRVFLDLISALGRSSYFSQAGVARRDLLWKAYGRATNDAERIEASLALAADSNDWHRGPDDSVAYSLYAASARLACRNPELSGELARALVGLAEISAKSGDQSTAIAFYASVADLFPGTASWGAAVFNRAYLLHKSGRHGASINALEPIFDSKVNDFEPGPHLMEAYRNYRHRSAGLIADDYQSMCNYPLAWWWELKAVEDYPYRTWCGTCRWDESRRSFYRLLKSSAAAGPLVFAGHVLSSPAKNWRFWFLILFLYFVWRRLRKWRTRIRQKRCARAV